MSLYVTFTECFRTGVHIIFYIPSLSWTCELSRHVADWGFESFHKCISSTSWCMYTMYRYFPVFTKIFQSSSLRFILSIYLYIALWLEISADLCWFIFAIPVIRWLLLRKRNGEIERRNQTRLKFAQALELPDISLRRKVNNIVVVLCPAVIILFLAKGYYSFSQWSTIVLTWFLFLSSFSVWYFSLEFVSYTYLTFSDPLYAVASAFAFPSSA